MKLATRIALSVTVVMPLLVLAAGLLVLGLVSRDLRQQQDARLQDRASAVLPDARALLAADRGGRPKAEQNQHRKVLGDALDAGIRSAARTGRPCWRAVRSPMRRCGCRTGPRTGRSRSAPRGTPGGC